jgi:putative methyltransferase (TIGR04325 family)
MRTTAKRVFRGLTPPYLWSIAAQLLREEKVFDTFEDAAKAAGSYNDELINRFRFARAELNRRRRTLVPLDGCPLLWLSALLPPGELVITDFGGATGEYGAALQAVRERVSYTVVENPTLVRMMSVVDLPIRFVTEIPDSCDIFFASGAVQYLPSPYEVLSSGFASATRAVALARTPFCEREIFRVQSALLYNNGWGDLPAGFQNTVITLPVRTISESRVRQLANQHGFRLIGKMTHEESSVFESEGGNVGQLVFLRDGDTFNAARLLATLTYLLTTMCDVYDCSSFPSF